MMSVARMATFAYYAREKLLEYYEKGAKGIGTWFGRGALALGLTGEALRADFLHLSRGFAPDGVTKLVQNAGAKDRIPGFDAVFSADKTVSATWAREVPEYRRAIEAAICGAGEDALQFLEDIALFTRRGKGGAIIERAKGMVASTWLETTNRAQQPNLHLHCPIFLAVLREDDTFGAVMGITSRDRSTDRRGTRSPLFTLRDQAGAVFQESLSKRMEALGYRMEKTQHGYAVSGVPRELCEQWSSRRQDIVRYMSERGQSGAEAARKAAVVTRGAKKHLPEAELFRLWKEQAGDFDPARLRSKDHEHAPGSEKTPGGEKSKTKSNSSSNARASEAEPQQPQDEARQDDRDLELAASIARLLQRGRRDGSHKLTRANVYVAAKQLEFVQDIRFTRTEKEALVRITRRRGAIQFLSHGPSQDRVECVLKAASKAWKRQGYRVLIAAPSRDEASGLEERTGIHSITATGLREGMAKNRGLLRGYDSAMKKSLSIVPGFKSTGSFVSYALKASGRWIRLDRKSVLVVARPDELKLEERADILRKARRAGAKVVFLGERESLTPADLLRTRERPRFERGYGHGR